MRLEATQSCPRVNSKQALKQSVGPTVWFEGGRKGNMKCPLRTGSASGKFHQTDTGSECFPGGSLALERVYG